MKIKELLKTVNVAWSPPAQYPILLAAGTAAQQLDASFNTSASLDLYSINLQQPGYEMELKASVASDHRFHKIIWGAYGNNPAGIIVGGCDYGTIKIYSASKMLSNENNCLISSPDRHTGPVRAMDFNPFQANLLATGATESEIYIWDVVNTSTPMTPGSRSQPSEDVQYIAWNKQVQHILASTFLQRCVIWDLRKNEPIIKLTDANSKVRWKVVQWHPNVATQLCLASEDDQAPVIELWDLRFATSPLKTLQNHQRGVLSIAWNPHDPDLLLSCAKDNRILCWNPNSNVPNGEVICELAQTNQWNFDVSWCPRHPGLIVGTSFDGHAAIYSLLGGRQQITTETSNKIVDSFPGMDPFTQPLPVVQTESSVILTKAPKWLKKPFGASFGFGGKLIIFENEISDPNLPANSNRKVVISQVITQPDLIQRSNELEVTLKNEQYTDYCKGKIDNTVDEHTKKIWSCVDAYFSKNVTKNILDLLGYNVETMNNKLNQLLPQDEVNTLAGGIANLNNVANGSIDGSSVFDAIAQEQHNKSTTPIMPTDNNFKINITDDDDGLITQAILLGNIEAAVTLCFKSKRYADAVIISMAGGPDLLAKTQYRYFSEHSGALNSLINSLVSENWTDIVTNGDIYCWKEILIGVFTHSSDQDRSTLCDMLGDRLASSENFDLKKQAQICYICSGNLNKLIEASEAQIQEVVELVIIMQKALEFQGIGRVQVEGKIANVLSQYAEMLAAEGNLEAALNYLENSQEHKVLDLRDRLFRALGYIQDTETNVGKASLNQNYNEQNYRPLQSQTFQDTYNPLSQAIPGVSGAPVYNWNATPTKQSFGSTSVPFNPQPAQSFITPSAHSQTPSGHYDQYSTLRSYGQQSVLQSLPPPPPTSGSNVTNSRPSSVGPQSRSKYLIDPSVKSTSSYGQNAFQQPFTQQPQAFISQQTGPIPSYNPQYPYQTQVAPSNSFINQSHNFMGMPPKETEPFKPPPPPPPSMTSTLQNFSRADVYNQHKSEKTSQISTYNNENSYPTIPQPSGWNDPPIAKSSRTQPILALHDKSEMSAEHAGTRKWKAKYSKNINVKVKPDFQSQSPILHPLRNTAPQSEANVLPQDSYYNEVNTPYNPQQYIHSIPNVGTQFNKPVDTSQSIAAAKAVEPEKPKLPIPEEHMHLKTILDELKIRCFESAKNPQIKRKIEDVSKKLETLYDCLRENKLSPNTLQGLHQISKLVQNGNYTGGLSLHTQLVSGPDFSQISSFMPGIKVLLQSALQLGVYIR